MRSKDRVTWLLFGVITVSMCGFVLPALQLAGDGCLFCPGNLGLLAGCPALLIWQLLKSRETKTPDWVSLAALGVIMFSVGLNLLMVLYSFVTAPSSDWWLYWMFNGTFLPAVAVLGYLVLLVRLLERVPGRRVFGVPPSVFLAGLGAELLFLVALSGFDWRTVPSSVGLGALGAAGCIAGMNRLNLAGSKPNRRKALVFMLILSVMGLIGVAFSTPTGRFQVLIQYRVGIRDFRNADLVWSNLRRADLSGADLSGVDLSSANLSGADLSDANLSETDLRLADLSKANLSKADLSRADLWGADLIGADLSDADLSRADLWGGDLIGADLSGADLSDAHLSMADLSSADLSEAKVTPRQLALAESLKGATMPDGTVHK